MFQVSDDVFHGGADFGELRVKFGLGVMKFGALGLRIGARSMPSTPR
jgi:hypothetical protein